MADTEIDGCPIAAGERVRPILAVAVHLIPTCTATPSAVDFARPSNKHLAFGAGVHRRVGSHLARLELPVALREWRRRIPFGTGSPRVTSSRCQPRPPRDRAPADRVSPGIAVT